MRNVSQMKADHALRMNVTTEDDKYPFIKSEMKPLTDEEWDKKNKEDQLLWEEEEKKMIKWREDHWVCLEGGDGYYDFKT